MIDLGRLDVLVTLSTQVSSIPTTDDGSVASTTSPTPSTVWAAIEPAGLKRMERLFGESVVAAASHLVTMHYHPGVTTGTKLTWTDVGGAHALFVTSVQNPHPRNIQLVLACTEAVV